MGVELVAVERKGFSAVDGDQPNAGRAVFAVVVAGGFGGQGAVGEEGDRAPVWRPLWSGIMAGVGERRGDSALLRPQPEVFGEAVVLPIRRGG